MSKRRNRQPHCQYCGEPVKWASIPMSGKRIALDASPDPGGTFMVQKRRDADGAEHTVAMWLNEQEAASEHARGTLLWKPHHATCPKQPGRAAPRVDPEWLAAKLAKLDLSGGRRG